MVVARNDGPSNRLFLLLRRDLRLVIIVDGVSHDREFDWGWTISIFARSLSLLSLFSLICTTTCTWSSYEVELSVVLFNSQRSNPTCWTTKHPCQKYLLICILSTAIFSFLLPIYILPNQPSHFWITYYPLKTFLCYVLYPKKQYSFFLCFICLHLLHRSLSLLETLT